MLIAAALGVILARNPVYSALLLVLCFFNSAVIWLLLDAEFLGIVLVLVYVGAVMVLFLFVVMMLDVNLEELRKGLASYWPLAVAVAGFVVFAMINVIVVRHLGGMDLRAAPAIAAGYSNTRELGTALFTRYAYPGADRRGDSAGGERRRHRADPAPAQGRQAPEHRAAGGGARQRPRANRQNGLRETPMITLTHVLTLSGILFAIAVAGVFLNRKNVIVLLMCIELMLLAVNFNFVAFSRYLGDIGGPDIRVLHIDRGGGRIGHRPRDSGRGVSRTAQHSKSKISTRFRAEGTRRACRGFISPSHWRRWRPRSSPDCSAGPSAGAGAHSITILGRGAVLRAVVLRAVSAPVRGGWPRYNGTVYTWLVSDGLSMNVGFLIDRLSALMMVVVTFVSLMVHVYTIGYMHDDDGYNALLQLHLPVHVLHADAGDVEQFPAAVLRLGSRGRGVLPADRLLVHPADRHIRQPQGLPGQPRGRFRLRARHRRGAAVHRIAGLRHRVRACRSARGGTDSREQRRGLAGDHLHLHLPVRRRHGQVPRKCPCTCGCPIPWKARRRSRR